MSTVIKGARIIDPMSSRDEVTDLYIDRGKIVALGKKPRGLSVAKTIDAKGLWLLPGLVDLSTRLREPGLEHKADIESELKAAAANGITSCIVPPDTDPPIDSPAVVDLITQRARTISGARVYCLGALTRGLEGTQLAEMEALHDIGCIGVSNAQCTIHDTSLLLHAFKYAKSLGLRVHYQPDDPYLGGADKAHESPTALRLGLPSSPSVGEEIDAHRVMVAASSIGTKIHLGRISSEQSLKAITQLRRKADIAKVASCDVGIAHLLFNEEKIEAFDTLFRMYPPLRSKRDQASLIQGIKKGHIDAICSDHQPHDRDAKDGAFMTSEPGLATLDGYLAKLYELARDHDIAFTTVLKASSAAPAQIAGIDRGRIEVGLAADLCLFDPKMKWRIDETTRGSRGSNIAWADDTLTGKVVASFVAGRVVYREIN